MRNKLIAIVGTNASGKSNLGVQLAKKYNGEIVSADSRQIYKRLDLGSGKISPEEMQGVPHHCIDIREPGEFFSMADFQKEAYKAIEGIISRGHVPFIVGGTGLYVDSVTDGYLLSDIAPDLEYRNHLETFSTEELYAKLIALYPDTTVDPKNRNRVMRCLEKIHDGDTVEAKKSPRYDVCKMCTMREREDINARIDERLEKRMQDGMVNEMRSLLAEGTDPEFFLKLGLEYKYLTRYVRGEYPTEEMMCAELATAIKQFAKRQRIWFRRDKSIIPLYMNDDPYNTACRAIDAFLAEKTGEMN